MIVSLEVGGDGHRAPLVGGVDDAVEGLGGVLAGGELADVVDGDELGPTDPGDDLGHRSVDLGPPHGDGERLQGEPRHPHAGVDDGVWARASTKCVLARCAGPRDRQVLGPVHPFQSAQRLLGR